jgi:Peptidase_C39 like family
MIIRRAGARVLAILIAAAAPSQASASGLLDVPFVSQSERLCGGAAAAMVLRFWGTRVVRAEDFASLVDDEAGGIRQSALVGVLGARGLTVLPLDPADRGGLARQIALGRPVVALIEDRPSRYHYVVIVGWTDDRVIYHDPARAPFRTITHDAFDRVWAVTNRWAIVPVPCASCLVPGADRAPGAGSVPGARLVRGAGSVRNSERASDSSCGALVAEGVRLAHDGDRAAAARALEVSVALCPGFADAYLELAGLRFLDGQWSEAETLAARAADLAPESVHAWRVLASSRFIEGDSAGALEAWNRVDAPRLDLIRVSGLERTSHRVVENLINLDAGTVLTMGSLGRARRRVAELPGISASRVTYIPAAGGLADLDVAVVERPLRPSTFTVVRRVAHAAVEREVFADVSGLTSSGERFSAVWRFWENRPAAIVRTDTPSLFGVSGLWTIEGSWSRQPYALNDSAIVVDERRHAGIRYANWMSDATRIEASTGLDRWSGRPWSAFVGGAIEERRFSDTLAARAEASIWPSGAGAFSAATFRLAWRAGQAEACSFRARGGFDAASADAPLDLWPGAGAGHVRAPRLRAHPLLDDGVVSGAVFGQRLAHASLDAGHPLLTRGLMRLDVLAFADAARAWRSLSGDRRLHVDMGVGLRLRGPADSGSIAIDVARGLRDGRTALTIGWEHAWPAW